jgi:hypothetical protein
MIPRRLKTKVQEPLTDNSSVVSLGPRQAGKTAIVLNLAKTIFSIYLNLEDSAQLEQVGDIVCQKRPIRCEASSIKSVARVITMGY